MNFHEMNTAMRRDLWLELYWHLVDQHGDHVGRGPFKDPQYHAKLIALLRKVGMNEEADDLETVRISDDDIRYGNTPMKNSFKVGDVLGHSRDREEGFRAAHNTYNRHLETIADKVHSHILEAGWEHELEGEYEFRYPEGEADLHRDAARLGYSLSGRFVRGDARRKGWKFFTLSDAEGNAVASGNMEDIESFLGAT